MNKIKLSLDNTVRHVFLGGIMKKSGNYLPLTNRERTMLKSFLKFDLILILTIVCWIIPFQELKIVHKIDSKPIKAVEAQSPISPEKAQIYHAEPEKQLFQVLDEFTAEVSAYNSFENQTDSTPCEGAFGYICDKTNVVANNCYKKGTIVEIAGIKYEVYDRMNKRYGCDVFDIYMGMDYEKAKSWGRRSVPVKILRFNK